MRSPRVSNLDGAGPWLGLIPSVILNARSPARVRCAAQVEVEVFGNLFGLLCVGEEEVSDPRSGDRQFDLAEIGNLVPSTCVQRDFGGYAPCVLGAARIMHEYPRNVRLLRRWRLA
jgi:hypothetical protein